MADGEANTVYETSQNKDVEKCHDNQYIERSMSGTVHENKYKKKKKTATTNSTYISQSSIESKQRCLDSFDRGKKSKHKKLKD